ncbi:hypothetical protein PG990_013869 [Apiospora arundinis]
MLHQSEGSVANIRLDLVSEGMDLRYPGVIRRNRKYLADALLEYCERTKQVSDATLCQVHLEDIAIDIAMAVPIPNLVYLLGYDASGDSLRTCSQRLTCFSVYGVFDEALFWPQAQEANATDLPRWRDMETIDVHLELNTPSGWWYFVPTEEANYGRPPRDPVEDPEDMPPDNDTADGEGVGPFDQEAKAAYSHSAMEDVPGDEAEGLHLRNVSHDDAMEPLFAAWARALACMPSLRTARLRFDVTFHLIENGEVYDVSLEDWEVIYEAPDCQGGGQWHADLDAAEQASRRLIFYNTGGWRPCKDTMNRLLTTGSECWPDTPMVVLAVR